MLEDQMVATRETEKISVANDDHSKFFILNETQERWIQKIQKAGEEIPL